MALELLSISDPPVTLADAKAHSRIDVSDDDDTLTGFIAAATEFIEGETRQQLRTTTYRLTLDQFPAGRVIQLPRPPLQGVQSVKYVHTGVEQTLDPATYTVDPSGARPGRITLNPGHDWPQVDDVANAVRVTFNAGHAPGTLPTLLRQAVLMMTAHYYEQREAAHDRTVKDVPLAVANIIAMNMFPEAV